ncbi:MAG: hypothetical protein A3E77_10560 [Sphingopyxis sp. RIFCSPHIGHO2_12_FULL_65_19]|nr:MAG: hypothetical protein A3E77_10560 [Sphingopyxis sp. RIFCSPHIGHO2_12_FULL_65_19]
MVPQAKFQRGFGRAGRVGQQAMPGDRMRPHHAHFAHRQRAGLVQDRVRNRDLADIVQQARNAHILNLLRVQAQMARKIDHQRTDRHRMKIGIFVLVLQPDKVDQRFGIALDRGPDRPRQRYHAPHFHRTPQPCSLEHIDDGLACAFDHPLGAATFGSVAGSAAGLVARRPPRRGKGRGGTKRHRIAPRPFGRLRPLAVRFWPLSGVLVVVARRQPAIGVDHHARNVRIADSQQLFAGFDTEIAAPERVIEPRPFKGVDEHSDLDIFGFDSNKHFRSRRAPSPRPFPNTARSVPI